MSVCTIRYFSWSNRSKYVRTLPLKNISIVLIVLVIISNSEALLCKYGYDVLHGEERLFLARQSYICATLQVPGCLTFKFSGWLRRNGTGWQEATGTIYHCDLTSSCGTYCRQDNVVNKLLEMDVTNIIGEDITNCNETCCFENNCNDGSKTTYSLTTITFMCILKSLLSAVIG